MALVEVQPCTPLEAVIKLYSLDEEVVRHHCKKWSKRTKSHTTPWPTQGACDLALVIQMQENILNYRNKDKSGKREIKRQQELHSLTAFMKLAKEKDMEHGRLLAQSADEIGRAEDEMEAGEGQMARRLIDLGEGEKNVLFGEDSGVTKDPLPGQLLSDPGIKVDSGVVARLGRPPLVSEMVEEGKNDGHLTTGYQEMFRMGLQLEKQRTEMRKVKRKFKQLEHFLMQKEKEERERDGMQASVRSADLIMPLITTGNVTHYQPWGHTDLDGLIFRLPILQEGAGSWIGKLEAEMVGKRLAVGDIKVLLNQILTKETATEVFNRVGLGRVMGDPLVDEVSFDTYRNDVWRALRGAYPNTLSLSSLSVNRLRSDENPAAFVEKAEADWCVQMETGLQNDKGMQQFMRKAIIEALPLLVRKKLENYNRIESMPRTEFRDTVTHFVKLQREIDDNFEKQEVERKRKVTQTQLNNLERGVHTQAPQLGVRAQGLGPHDMLNSGYAPLAPQRSSQPLPGPQLAHGPPPQTHWHLYWPPQPYPQGDAQQWGHSQVRHRGGGAGTGRGGVGRGQNRRGEPQKCWVCGRMGHISRDCAHRQEMREQRH